MTRNHYHLYIDDHGSRNPDHVIKKRDDGMDCFALGGILVHESNIDIVVTKHKAFCAEWDIDYPLHSTDIRGLRGDFRWLQDSTKDTRRFSSELNALLTSIPILGFAAVVNRPGYNERYREKYGDDRWLLCKTAYAILIERVAKYCISQNATFEVFFERSGKKEDRAIKAYGRILKREGLPFASVSSTKYSPLQPDELKRCVLGEPRERTKKCIFTQLSDLYLYPMVKRKYDRAYRPWVELFAAKRVIDAVLAVDQVPELGIKYSCFDASSGSTNPRTGLG